MTTNPTKKPTSHALKKLVRARMAATGESYTTALRYLRERKAAEVKR
jgi:hypothetical protein